MDSQEQLMKDAQALQRLIDESHHIVFFGGAGVSTESGIPDFRSRDGIYYQKYDYDPEVIISAGFFYQNPKEFYRFYKDKMINLNAKPNAAHQYLTQLEQKGKLKCVITQNIDGLHQMAGSKNVVELHGTIHRNICQECGKTYNAEYVMKYSGALPLCTCGGLLKPDVVLYGEPLDEFSVTKAMVQIQQADLLIVAGTSLVVYPAASFIDYFNGKNLVLINLEKTSKDNMADLVIHQKVGELFSLLHV